MGIVSKLTKNPENSSTGTAVTGPTNVATWEVQRIYIVLHITSAKKMCIKQCKHALPVVRWRQHQPTAQETGLPEQCRWTGL